MRMCEFYTNFSITTAEFIFSSKSQPAFLLARFLIWRLVLLYVHLLCNRKMSSLSFSSIGGIIPCCLRHSEDFTSYRFQGIFAEMNYQVYTKCCTQISYRHTPFSPTRYQVPGMGYGGVYMYYYSSIVPCQQQRVNDLLCHFCLCVDISAPLTRHMNLSCRFQRSPTTAVVCTNNAPENKKHFQGAAPLTRRMNFHAYFSVALLQQQQQSAVVMHQILKSIFRVRAPLTHHNKNNGSDVRLSGSNTAWGRQQETSHLKL